MNIVSPSALKRVLQQFKITHVDSKKVTKKSSKISLTSATSTIQIGIEGFDKTKQTLLVFQDGKYVEEVDEYTISEDSASVTFVSEIAATSESPILIRFVVLSI